MHHNTSNNIRPPFDKVITDMTEYVLNYKINSSEAIDTARYCLLDSLACGFLALAYPACTKLLGPVVPGATLKNGARIPGTAFELEPIQAAFNIGAMVRWLDFNDTWLAAEWGHPSDNLGALLAVMDYLERDGKQTFKVRDLLHAMIKAHEIQGVMALENAFNRVGLDHVVLVKVAPLPHNYWVVIKKKFKTPYLSLGLMAKVYEPIAMHPILVRVNLGPPVMPLHAPCA